MVPKKAKGHLTVLAQAPGEKAVEGSFKFRCLNDFLKGTIRITAL